jgi:serine protease Do
MLNNGGFSMSQSTNQLIAKLKKFAVLPLAVAVFSALALPWVHSPVKAAAPAAAALDSSSVSSLVALDQAVEAVAARVTPAVVNVTVTSKASHASEDGDDMQRFFRFFGPGGGSGGNQEGPRGMRPQPQMEHGIGSGVIVSPDGYIVTNNHVVDGAVELRVTLNDRRVLPAKLIGTDKLTDLAVIKVDATNLPSVPWGDSRKLHPGQTVLAFGSPFGYFQFSVTRGIVSAVNRPNPFSDDARKPGGFIQTDAAINRGNSGGPLVNAYGEVVGINTFLISDTGNFAGAGFAIPSQVAKSTVDSIVKTGSVRHGYLGIGINDVTPENAKFFHLEESSGALVSQVTPGSPAAKAGFQVGDVIRQADEAKVLNASDLQMTVSQHTPGSKMTMHVMRDGKPQTLDITLGEFHAKGETEQASADDTEKGSRLGVAVADLTPDVRQQLDLPAQVKGVVIQEVQPGSPAEDAGISRGDVILEINRQPVQSSDQFVSDVHKLAKDKDLLLLVWSKGGTSFRVLHPAVG